MDLVMLTPLCAAELPCVDWCWFCEWPKGERLAEEMEQQEIGTDAVL